MCIFLKTILCFSGNHVTPVACYKWFCNLQPMWSVPILESFSDSWVPEAKRLHVSWATLQCTLPIDGYTVGSPLTPILADTFMKNLLEEQIVSGSPTSPLGDLQFTNIALPHSHVDLLFSTTISRDSFYSETCRG